MVTGVIASLALAQLAPPLTIPVEEFGQRRQTLLSKMSAGDVAVFLAAPVRNRQNDVDYRYRNDSNFLYLTGLEEPNAALILAPSGISYKGQTVRELLLSSPRDPGREVWMAPVLGPEVSKTKLKLQATGPITDLKATLDAISATALLRPTIAEGDWHRDFRAAVQNRQLKPSLERAIGEMRVVKSAAEIALLKRAIDATVVGHIEAMKSAEPGMSERDIQAIAEYCFARFGCEYQGYPSIVGGGKNACVLHYDVNREKIGPNDIVLIDAGGEYQGYTADVTRSYPLNGKFSPAQREIYELVLAAQNAGIAACRAGASFRASDTAARSVIAKGLIRLGITKTEAEASRYFMHGTSHYLGLDVHDSHGSNTLAPNMVLTVEPGIYIRSGSPCPEKYWNIGIRIEDDILVTTGDPVNLSVRAPRSIAEIERLMAQKGVGNVPIGDTHAGHAH